MALISLFFNKNRMTASYASWWWMGLDRSLLWTWIDHFLAHAVRTQPRIAAIALPIDARMPSVASIARARAWSIWISDRVKMDGTTGKTQKASCDMISGVRERKDASYVHIHERDISIAAYKQCKKPTYVIYIRSFYKTARLRASRKRRPCSSVALSTS